MSAEPVGSLAEEAAKLIAALQGWAQDQMQRPGADRAGADDVRNDDAATDDSGSQDERNRAMTEDHRLGRHDPLAPECRYCPLCALARMAKVATPEVRDHLASAAFSLALAFKGLLEANARTPSESTPVEKIDLAED